MENLYKHIYNLKNKFGLNVVVAVNRFITDTMEELAFVYGKLEEKSIVMSVVDGWENGSLGTIDIVEKILDRIDNKTDFKYIYDDNDSIQDKILKVATKIYGAESVKYEEKALENIKKIEQLGKSDFPICIAKTQYSLSDDDKNLQCKEPFSITVRDVQLRNGAEFIVVLTGKILTMPGLPKIPASEGIDIDEDGNIIGIF